MAVTFVRSASAETTDGSTTAMSFGALPSAGNFIVVVISNYHATTPAVSGVADNQGNGAYTKAKSVTGFANSKEETSIWYKENIGSPSGTFTVTVTPTSGTQNYTVACIAEFSGVATSSSKIDDGSDLLNVTSTDASVTTAGTAASAGDLVVAGACAGVDGATNVSWGAAASTGYTNIYQYANWSAINTLSADFKVAGSGGSQSAAWSHVATSGASDGWGAVIAVFAAAGGGGGPTIPVFMNQYRQRGN